MPLLRRRKTHRIAERESDARQAGFTESRTHFYGKRGRLGSSAYTDCINIVSGHHMAEVTTIAEVVNALRSRNARCVGIDGSDGVGKSTLAKAVASEMGLPIFHLDDYLVRKQGGFLEFLQYPRLRQEIASASEYIIEGVCLLKALDQIGATIDVLVYVKRYHLGCWSDERELDVEEPLEQFLKKEREFVQLLSADKSSSTDLGLSEEIIRYHYARRPHRNAQLIFRRDDC